MIRVSVTYLYANEVNADECNHHTNGEHAPLDRVESLKFVQEANRGRKYVSVTRVSGNLQTATEYREGGATHYVQTTMSELQTRLAVIFLCASLPNNLKRNLASSLVLFMRGTRVQMVFLKKIWFSALNQLWGAPGRQ